MKGARLQGRGVRFKKDALVDCPAITLTRACLLSMCVAMGIFSKSESDKFFQVNELDGKDDTVVPTTTVAI